MVGCDACETPMRITNIADAHISLQGLAAAAPASPLPVSHSCFCKLDRAMNDWLSPCPICVCSVHVCAQSLENICIRVKQGAIALPGVGTTVVLLFRCFYCCNIVSPAKILTSNTCSAAMRGTRRCFHTETDDVQNRVFGR